MYPMIDLGFLEIPTYWILNLLGVFIGYFFIKRNNKHKAYRLPSQDILYLTLFTMIGAIIGARLMFVITYIPQIIENPSIVILLFIRGGSVFLGGVIGGFFFAILYIKMYGLDPVKYFNLFIISVPLGHAIGRIGCFMAGCCYGKPTDSFLGVVFPEGPVHPHGIGPVHPTQLYAVAYNLIIFAVLMVLFYKLKKHKPYFFLGIYMIMYSTFRFINEFFRGDEHRGVWFLSTSQWITLFMFFLGLFVLLANIQKYHWFHQTEPTSKSYKAFLEKQGQAEK